MIAQAFDEDNDPPGQRTVDELDDSFRHHLLDVLRAPTAEEGTGLARILDEEIRAAYRAGP